MASRVASRKSPVTGVYGGDGIPPTYVITSPSTSASRALESVSVSGVMLNTASSGLKRIRSSHTSTKASGSVETYTPYSNVTGLGTTVSVGVSVSVGCAVGASVDVADGVAVSVAVSDDVDDGELVGE